MRNRPYQVLKCSSAGRTQHPIGTDRGRDLNGWSHTASHWQGGLRRPRWQGSGCQRQQRCRRQSMVTIAHRRRTHRLSRQKIDRWWSSTGPGLSKQLSRRYSTPPPPLLMRSSMSAAGSTWSVTRRDLLMVAAAAASRSTCRTTCVRWAQSVSAVAARSDVRSTNPCRHGTPAVSMMWPGANKAVPHSSKASFTDCAPLGGYGRADVRSRWDAFI